MTVQPDRALWQAAGELEAAARLTAEVRRHINLELEGFNGRPSATGGDGMPHGNSITSIVERQLIVAHDLIATDAQIAEDRTTIVVMIRDYVAMLHRVSRVRLPRVESGARCRDNQVGRDGALVWGRPDCLELAVKAGYCTACYQRERRWRIAKGLPERDVEPAAERETEFAK